MKKRVMALMLIIPVIFMIALFSVGKAAGVYTDIPVSGIRITTQNDEGFINVDFNGATTMRLTAQVEPVNARNQKYVFSASGVNGEDAEGIEVSADGLLTITDVGKARITATSVEKGFKDSVIVNVFTDKAINITPCVNDEIVLTDEEGNLFVGLTGGVNRFSATVYPSSASGARIIWSSSDENILQINPVTGDAKALLSGTAEIRAECPDGIGGGIVRTVNASVNVKKGDEGIAVNGMSDNAVLSLKNGTDTAVIYVESQIPLEQSDADVSEIGAISDFHIIGEENDLYRYKITIDVNEFEDTDKTAVIYGKDGKPFYIEVKFGDYSFDVHTSYHRTSDGTIYQKNKTEVSYVAYSDFDDAGLTFVWTVSEGEDVIEIVSDGINADITAKKRGKATIEVVAKKGDKEIYKVIKTVEVVANVLSVEFVDGAKEYGIENVLAVGSRAADGLSRYRKMPLVVRTEGDESEDAETLLDFCGAVYSDPGNLLNVSGNEISANTDGVTTLCAELEKYNAYFGTDFKAEIKIRSVKEGVFAGNYRDLKRATVQKQRVVLTDNVMLGTDDNGNVLNVEELQKDVKTMLTTYDWQFYENKGAGRPSVLYVMEFAADVYGNGFEINADYFTKCEDGTGNPVIFKGPLDFVSITSAAVKAQDNVAFLVREDGVILDNVVLKGCKDESLYDSDGKFNLSGLNNTGTTLEIASDGVRLLNSRVSNGRTTVRIFGGGDGGNPIMDEIGSFKAENERINVSIESCVLSNAREFILKTGSNRAVRSGLNENGKFEQYRLKTADGAAYYEYDANNAGDDYFNERYLITDVTLKDSVLETSGLFSIGMETHFSGTMLNGGIKGWENCAATSLASALRIVGDVKILDWKKLSNVDSSTLIETTSDASDKLRLNVSAMLTEVKNQNAGSKFDYITAQIGDEEYVHGGIAFYGGGYNYSYLDMSEAETESLTGYAVNIAVLKDSPDKILQAQGQALPMAAGTGDFMFYLYNSQSASNYYWQEEIKGTGVNITPAAL